MDIKLQTLRLTRYSERIHKRLKNELETGESSSPYIHQIGERLEFSKDNEKNICNSAFVVLDKETPIGYLFISSIIRDEVFLEYAILKEFRGMGYATRLVNETSEYLFLEHNIKSIRLDINPSNKKSLLVASSCGFVFDDEDYEIKNYVGKMQFVRESDYYISKRRK